MRTVPYRFRILSFAAILCSAMLLQSCGGTKEQNATLKPESNSDIPLPVDLPNETLIESYIDLKNRLADDDFEGAKTQASHFKKALELINRDSLQNKEKFMGVIQSFTAEIDFIQNSAKNLAEQRNAFVTLSQIMVILIEECSLPTNMVTYKFNCATAQGGKGADWISETEKVFNPFDGSKNLSCGKIVQTFPNRPTPALHPAKLLEQQQKAN